MSVRNVGTVTANLRGAVMDTLDLALAHGLSYAEGCALDALLAGDTQRCVDILVRQQKAGMVLADGGEDDDEQLPLPFESDADRDADAYWASLDAADASDDASDDVDDDVDDAVDDDVDDAVDDAADAADEVPPAWPGPTTWAKEEEDARGETTWREPPETAPWEPEPPAPAPSVYERIMSRIGLGATDD